MRSTDVAALIVSRQGEGRAITNLGLNALVYFAQVESLKTCGKTPLFDDRIESWEYGPMEPAVYHELKKFGRDPVCVSPRLAEAADRAPGYAKRSLIPSFASAMICLHSTW